MPVLRVAVPSPLRRLFDYLPPVDLSPEDSAQLQPGVRVQVPFGKREITAILVSVHTESDVPPDALKHALTVLDEAPLITANMFALCQWSTEYYHQPPGEVYPTALPVNLRKGRPTIDSGTSGWQLTVKGLGLPNKALAAAPKQAEAIGLLQQGSEVADEHFKSANISRAILKALEEKQLIERCSIAAPTITPLARPGLALNSDQAGVVENLTGALGSFSCHLIEGVTGSGKTEIYLQAIAQCLSRGEQALVLIPEIGLTPQTVARFHQRFDADIRVLHSGLGDRERELAWHAAREGRAHIIIGTRSAVFTPLARPGLIIVDEEHDSSYKQQDGFRYSARDVAIKRAQIEACPIVLGSATPALESLHNALTERYRLHQLPHRAGNAQLPEVRAIDVRRQALEGGISAPLHREIATTLANGGQVLLFLNRRGYAPSLQCHDCGWIAECRACDARLTVHRRQRRLRCHHCGASHTLPSQCPDCRGQRMLTNGLGTEQAEEVISRQFNKWAVHRVDSDTVQGREGMAALNDVVAGGEPCILIGTQMLSKGHHFPGVQLVGVLDADALLFSADFRGEERMAQLLTQVAGRAGRAQNSGTVLLQTHHPDHPAMLAALEQTYSQRARALLDQRQQAGLPPFGHLVMFRCDSVDATEGERFLQRLRSQSRGIPGNVSIIGPLPSALPRRAGRYRFQLTLLSSSRASIHQATHLLISEAERLRAPANLKWTVDVDATEVM